jgi:hypothetical protein
MTAKILGKVDLGWRADTIVLPIDKAALFLSLYAEGMHRKNGNWDNPGLSRRDHEGNEPSLPSIEAVTLIKYELLLHAGQEHDREAADKRAAELAAEQAKAEKANA